MNVSESIRNLRESKNLTQEQFGKIAGVSSMAVSQWENGRAVPRMGAIQKLSDFFDIPKSVIMGDDGGYEKVDQPALTPQERQLLDLFREMDPDYRDMLLKSAVAYSAMTEKDTTGDGADARLAVTYGAGGES